MKWSWRVSVFLALILLALVVLGGCRLIPPASGTGNDQADPAPVEEPITLILFFGGPNAEGLAREERTVLRTNERTEELVIQELIKGPESEQFYATIPEGTRLLDIQVSEGTAVVDFSGEIQTQHPGGTTGETLTVYSIVNSLTELPGIVFVQILIEGETADSLAGHIEIREPLARNPFVILP